MTVEVFTVGGGDYVVNVLNAVSAWTGSGGYKSMISVTMVMGLAYMLFVVAFSLDWRAWLNWFLQSFAIYGMLMVPTTSVKVTDHLNPQLAPAMVDNVPIGLGMLASFTSQIADYLTTTAETVFQMPNELQYSNNGFVYGSKLFEATRQLQITDPIFAANVNSYIKQCTFYDLLLGFKNMNALASATDLWAAMGPGSQARAVPQLANQGGTTTSSILPCNQAYATLDAQWTPMIQQLESIWAKKLYPSMSNAVAQAKVEQDLPVTYQAFTNNSSAAFNILRQHMSINAFIQARADFSGGAGQAQLDSFAAGRADLQTENTYNAIAVAAMKWVPILNIVLTVIFYAMFPVIFPLFLMPRTGVATLKGYGMGFFYLAAWGPLYVVLHMILMSRGIAAAQATAPGGTTLATFAGIGAVNDETATLAGYLIGMVPFIAAGMARGAAAIAGQATSFLAPSQNAAEAAALEETTGNYSYGNASLANSTVNTQTRDQWNTAPSFRSGNTMSTFVGANGSSFTSTADGSEVIDTTGAMSRLPYKPSLVGSQFGEARQTVSDFHSQSTQMADRASNSYTAATNDTMSLFDTLQHGQSSDTSKGTSETEGTREARANGKTWSDTLVNQFGWSKEAATKTANLASSTSDWRASYDASIKPGGVLGKIADKLGFTERLGASAGYGQRGSHETSDTLGATADDRESRGLAFLNSVSSTSSAERARDNFIRATANSSDSHINGLSHQREARLSDAKTFSAETARLNDEGKRFERSVGLSESNGFQWTEDLSQRFVQFARREMALNPPLQASGWEPGQVGELTPQQDWTKTELQRRFGEQYLAEERAKLGPVGPLAARPLASPGFSSRGRLEGWGRGQQAGLAAQGPKVDTKDDLRDPSLQSQVDGQFSSVNSTLAHRAGQAATSGRSLASGRSRVDDYARERTDKTTVGSIPAVDGIMSYFGHGDKHENPVDGRPLARSLGVDIKPGANISSLTAPMVPAVKAVASSARDLHLPQTTITSGNDSHQHKRGGAHYRDAAVDFRGNNITAAQGQDWSSHVSGALGPKYYVNFETFPLSPDRNHLHVQVRQPR